MDKEVRLSKLDLKQEYKLAVLNFKKYRKRSDRKTYIEDNYKGGWITDEIINYNKHDVEFIKKHINNLFGVKSKELDDVLTALDELYAWSVEGGALRPNKETVQETVKVIENYLGVRK